MKKHIQLFEEFILLNPAEEIALKKQFMTSAVTANVPVTHQVSKIVRGEKGISVEVNPKNPAC
jgi:hypothetical protein